MINSGSVVPAPELCLVALFGVDGACFGAGMGSTDEYRFDVLREERRTPPFTSASSTLSKLSSEAGASDVGVGIGFCISSGS